jgi:ABC-type bacteriocin/lantibiotic exporter with double-glycine peptidase domain
MSANDLPITSSAENSKNKNGNGDNSLTDIVMEVDPPKVDNPSTEKIIANASNRAPIESILHDCRKSFYYAFFITAVADIISIAPMLYMMNVFDRVITTRSGLLLCR